MHISLSPESIDDYRTFLTVKTMPIYRVIGSSVSFPDEYAKMLGEKPPKRKPAKYKPSDWLFDYQKDIARIAIEKRRYSVFADCGLGKTAILLEFAKHVSNAEPFGRVLIVSPLMVVRQTCEEAKRFYGDTLGIQQLAAADLPKWLQCGTGIAITNYEAITDDLPESKLAGLILDESSMLKSHYGAWGTRLLAMGRGVEYKLCLTGTPAPNDRIEYANHAVFMDAFPNVNSFLARFFVNRGQTSERWELKKHALAPFYVALSHWCIFLSNPSTYGWKDNCGTLPPIHVHVEDVPVTAAQRDVFMRDHGQMFVNQTGGIGSRGKIARIGKGFDGETRIDSNKTGHIARLIASWPDESTIVWCKYNQEQADVAAAIPGCGNISGDTPVTERHRIIEDFKARRIRCIVTKAKVMGFGLNLQVCTRQVFSGLQDSYEEFYQAVKRSNRYGSTRPLNVHIPTTEFERPMIETVLAKASRVQADTEQQERIFREHASQR
jgi:superfamily II DNA or RNA helicase